VLLTLEPRLRYFV